MHGLVNRSIQMFLRGAYGPGVWLDVARDAQLGFDTFEAMLSYDDYLTELVLAAASRRLSLPREAILEDLGIFLVADPALERLRRLLRFGGVTFVDFLHSLDDLPARGRLALPDLEVPTLRLGGNEREGFLLTCGSHVRGVGHVVVGLLRAMADDYGALVLIEHAGALPGGEGVSIQLLESQFASGRRFDLAGRAFR
jgi:hypothetical protein